MRILSVNKFYYLHGGAERYFFDLNRLLKLRGHRIIPFAMNHPENKESEFSAYFVPQIDYFSPNGLASKIKAGLNVIYSKSAQNKINGLINATNPQIAHLHNIAHQLSPSILYALRNNGIPIIQTLHDLKLLCPVYTMFSRGEVCERCINGKYYNVLQHQCNKGSYLASAINMVEMYLHNTILHSYDQVDAFIAPSSFLRNKMIEGGVPHEKIHLISYHMNLDEYPPHFKNDGYLLFFGQLITVKGVDILLQAIQKLPDVHLVVAGRGADEERFESFAQEHNINVSFVGFQSGTDLERLIQNSLLVIVPSIWYENQPFSILESFAYGKPVIASRLGGMAELVTEGETGYLFEAGNAQDLAEKIKIGISSPTKLVDMGHIARKKIEREFNADEHYQKIIKLYQQCL